MNRHARIISGGMAVRLEQAVIVGELQAIVFAVFGAQSGNHGRVEQIQIVHGPDWILTFVEVRRAAMRLHVDR